MFNKKAIIDSLRNLNKPTKFSNKNTFDFKEEGSKKEGFISAKEGVDTPIYKAVKVGASPIEGKGLFAEQSIKKGDVIGISHIRKKFMKDGEQYQAPFPSTVLGYYNHSEEPNVYEVDKGDHILMVAGRDIQRGQELTSDYSKHNIEDLEVPEDFKKGGATKRPKIPKGKSPKSYSRSFEATNRLFAENPLFAKPKSRKNKIFDPRSKYYANGGITYNNLPATYQSALESFVYPNVEDDPSRTGYNSVNSTISYDSESPIENMSNDWWREHEMFHHLQNIAGGMSTSGIVGQRPNPYVASDEAMRAYYDRRDSDINRIVDEMIAENPDLQFIPRHKLIEGSAPGFIGAEALQYSDPTTLEGEARQYEQYIREGNPSIFPKQKYGGLTQYAPGGYSDEPPGSKKKPYRDSKAILPRWMPKGMIKAIQNTEVGISPLMSNEQAYPIGMKKNFTDIATTGENLLGEGTGAMGVSNPSYGINFTTGLTRDISKNKGSGWALKGYLGKPYDPSMGKAAGAALERLGEEAYDKVWDEYNQDVEAYYAGTMAPSVLNSEEYGPDGWTPEAAKPKYDGKLARGLGKAMQKSPLIGGLSAHYRYDKFKQPHGYKAAGEGEIKLDWDPSNNIGLGLKGGLEFSGGNKYQSKNYKPGSYKWNINPSVTAGIGTRPNFGFNLNAGVEGLPSFMPKKFPGYFYGDVNYNQSLIGPGSLSANAGMKFPLNQYKERRAKQRVQEKQKEENLNPQTVRNTTFEYGGIPVELTQDEIQKYVDGGYVVEELPKASLGKEKKTYTAPKIHEVEFKPAEIQTYNPSLKEYQIYNVELPDRIVPGRDYADVKHKMANLRKDLGISTLDHMINKYIPGAAHPISLAKDSGIVIDPMSGQLFDSNTRYWLNREYGFEPNINELLFPLSSTIARDYGTLKMSSDTPFENRKMGINYMDELANPYTQKNGLLDLFGQPAGGPLMIGMGMMGKPEFTKEIKNPDYFTQLLNTFDTKRLSYSSRKYYQDLINSVKNQNGLATERQYNELQRLKTGDFNFGKRGYAEGGLVKAAKGLTVKTIKDLGRATNIGTFGTANTLAKTVAPIMIHPSRIPLLGARIENVGPFTGSPLNVIPFYGKKIEASPNTAFRKFGDTMDYVKMSGELNPAHGPLIRMGKDQIMNEGNWAALNQPNEWYPGVMTAKFDFNKPGTNLGFTSLPGRDGVLITDAMGNKMPSIPISDPGLSFQRRLPFSNRYVDVNMEKLRNNQFDFSTVGTNTQALLERYGYGMGYAALLGAMGLSTPQNIIDDYINKPLVEGYKKYIQPAGQSIYDFWKPKNYRLKEDGTVEEYAKGGLVKKLLSRKRKSISQPEELTNLKSQLIQPGEEAFPLPENEKGELWYDPIVAKEMTQEELDAYNKAHQEQLKKEKFEADKAAQPGYFDEARTWLTDWHNSPMYNQMVLNSYRGNQANADYLTKLRKKNIETMPPLNVIEESNGSTAAHALNDTGQVEVFPSGYKYGPSIFVHEGLHASDRPRELYKWNHPSYKVHNEDGTSFYNYPDWMIYSDPRFPNDPEVWHDRVIPKSDQMYITTHRGSNWKDNQYYKNEKKEGWYTPKTDEQIKQDLIDNGFDPNESNFNNIFEETKKQNKEDVKNAIYWDKKNWKEFGHDYVSSPTEVRARLGEIRYGAQKEGIYDPFTEQITPETFQNVIDNGSNWQMKDAIEELRNDFTDEEIFWMLQNISKNETGEDENKLQYGKYGGQFELGDEVDEATMKQLMKLGYTFEKI